MTRLVHNFDGGPDGTFFSVANSAQVPGNDPFDGCSVPGTGKIFNYYDANALARPTAEYVLRTATGSTSLDATALWNTSMGTKTQIWLRFYIYLTELPSTAGATFDVAIFVCDNGSAYTGFIQIEKATGKLFLLNGPLTQSVLTTNPLPLDAWARVEARFQFSTTTGNADLKLFLEPDSDDETEMISGTGWNSGAANANDYAFAQPFARAHKPETYFSGIELNDTGWPGPAPWKVKGVPGILTNPIAIHTAAT